MKCPHCQSENLDGVNFCSNCGSKLSGTPAPEGAFVLEDRFKGTLHRGIAEFVGREQELEILKAAFEKVKFGSGQAVEIVGEAGVGKSRLLHEFRHMLPREAHHYFEGRCIDYASPMPYLPILHILRSLFDVDDFDAEEVIKTKIKDGLSRLEEPLEKLAPPIQEILSLKVEDATYLSLEPEQKKQSIFEALTILLEQVSQEKPLILTIEDTHWIDKTTEEFIHLLIGDINPMRILLILLYRPQYSLETAPKPHHRRIILEPLSEKGSSDLVQAILRDASVDLKLKAFVLNKAHGNPLFVEEIIQNLLENGAIQKRVNEYVLAGAASDI